MKSFAMLLMISAISVILAGVMVPAGVTATALISSSSASTQPLDGVLPGSRQRFQQLSDAATYYLALSLDPRWQPLPAGPLLRQGDWHPQVDHLRQLLVLYGDLDYRHLRVAQANYFDPPLQLALMAFQYRHGASADGILGPKTRDLLNVPPRQRAAQIAVNIDRQQRFSGDRQGRFVQVNIPEFRLHLFDQGVEVLAMKTIIGRDTRPTPVLESQIRSLVFNPGWNVPKSIAYNDILPRWQKDPHYLQKHNLKVVSGWRLPRRELAADQVDPGQFYTGTEYLRFWQPPGDNNTMGRVKFMFPNNYSVYLHDTPGRGLFRVAERAFSSGCIRLEKPMQLALTLMNSAGDQSATRIQQILDGGQTTRIELAEPVPLYLTYWTAWLDSRQILHFGEDIYHQDQLRARQALLKFLAASPGSESGPPVGQQLSERVQH